MGTPRQPRRDAPFIDDRRRALNLAPDSVLIGQVWSRYPVGLWLGRWWPMVIMAVVCSVLAARDLARGVAAKPIDTSGLVPLALVVCGAIVVRLATRQRPRSGPSTLGAYLAAHRRCGACGYDLHQIAPEADGCVVCPECGAAWHQHRFVLADRDPTSGPMLSAVASEGHVGPSRNDDDRGVRMLHPWAWPPAWLADLPPGPTDDVVRAGRAQMRRLRRWGVPLSALVWLAGLAFLLRVKEEPEPADVVLFTIVTFLIAGLVYWAVIERVMSERVTYGAVRSLGLCLSCGTSLPTHAPRTFDGCVVCESCKRAWSRVPGGEARGPGQKGA